MTAAANPFDHVPVGIALCGSGLDVRSWNLCIEDWTGVRRSEILGKPLVDYFPRFSSARYRARLQLLLEGGPPVIFSYQLNGCLFPHVDPKRRDRVQHVTATGYLGGNGERLILFAVEDRSEVSARIRASRQELSRRVETEAVLRKSIAEKEYLMRELNHRVKNNLNMIQSLVSLQRDGTQDGPTVDMLDDIAARIRSFSRLYDTMHRQETLDHVRLDAYLESIAREQFETLKLRGSSAVLETDLEALERPAQEALHVGLVASEALTNAMKYGLAGREGGVVRVRLRAAGTGVELTVEDDGPGYPPGFDPEKGSSLGLKLVGLLAEETGGRVRCETAGGARLVAEFSTGSGST